MKKLIFNNSLEDREKLYFSILKTVREFKKERSEEFETNGKSNFQHA